jgi:hypothetical protein
VSAAAAECGIDLLDGPLLRNATDGLYPLLAGYPSVALGSVGPGNVPANYHWPTDTPDRVNYRTLLDAVSLCERVVRSLAAGWPKLERDTARMPWLLCRRGKRPARRRP